MSIFSAKHFVAPKPQLGSWQPSDQGFKAWTSDPINGFSNSTALPTAGLLNIARLRIAGTQSISNIIIYVGTGGTTLTAGQCFAALYRASGTLIAQTADQATAWASGGLKTMALTGAPFSVSTDVYAALWFNGTAGPQIARSTNLNAPFVNANLSAPNFRIASADAGVTITAPATLGTQTAVGTGWWVALS